MLRKLPALSEIGQVLDDISYEWVSDNHPELLEAIEKAVERGVDPSTVRRFVMLQTDRSAIALRCQQVARSAQRSLENDN